ncbi:DUF732 domain-containing protein [Streptomyces cinereoruber]|uniref:DUF732 domain-containing protein n=1 Tax=Streptomyces cinereoruber TaxID=67260 RepID=UPI003635282D
MPDDPARPDSSEDSPADAGSGRSVLRAVGWQVGAVVTAVVVLVAAMALRGEDRERPRAAPSGSPSSAPYGDPADSEPSAATSSSDPSDGPPYTTVPRFGSDAARDVAFAGQAAQLSWSLFVWPYNVMSSSPSPGIEDFREAVVKQAGDVCGELAGGTSMNDLPRVMDLHLEGPLDEAAFIVEAVAFYCPAQTAAITGGVYTEPVPVEQNEDCPTPSALEITTSITGRTADEYIHEATYEVDIRNTSSYPVRVELEQLWTTGPSDEWEPYLSTWSVFGEVGAEHHYAIAPGATFHYEGTQTGSYPWKGTSVRVKPGEHLFLDCGYQAGPRAAGGE